jgi:type II secretory pathway component PulK
VVAMFALAVIGALVAGAFFAGRVEQQSGQNVLYAAQAREAAEAGLARAIAEANPEALDALASGGAALDLGSSRVGPASSVRTTAARLTGRLILLSAVGTRHDALGGVLAIRTLGLLVEVPSASGPVARVVERSWLQLH